MHIKKNQILRTENKKPIIFDMYSPQNNVLSHLIIFCHGYKGFKDWGAWHLAAEAFVEAGFHFLKFNFSHNGGTMEAPIDFPDLKAFSNNNYSKELEDLERIINYVSSLEHVPSKISLIGHSRGGGIVLIKAEEDFRINNVITWAGVSDFKSRFNENSPDFEQWKDTGVKYVMNGRTRQQMPHLFQFYTDFKENEERLTINRAVKNLQIPQLIIQGTADAAVIPDEAFSLHQWNPKSELKMIKDSNHVFGASHPWKKNTLPADLHKVIKLSISFLKQQ